MRSNELKIFIPSLILFSIICIFCLHRHLKQIPESLRLECIHAIQLSGGKYTAIAIDGRDVRVRGIVSEARLIDQVMDSLLEISGIRKLDMDFQVDPDSIQAQRLRYWAAQVVYFNKGSSILTDSSFEMIDSLALYMNQNPDKCLTIRGWTDREGDFLYNQILSERRASSVRKALILEQCDSTGLHTLGWGEQWPDSLFLEASLARRVDFILKERIP